MDPTTIASFILGSIALSSMLGAYVAAEKNRPVVEGIVFGVMLGPIGVIIVACLPAKPKSATFYGFERPTEPQPATMRANPSIPKMMPQYEHKPRRLREIKGQ